jgi:hypothetical protein
MRDVHAVREELEQVLPKVSKANLIIRLVDGMERRSGITDASWLQEAINGYYKMLHAPTRIGIVWALQALQAILCRSHSMPPRAAVTGFLRWQASQPKPPLHVQQLLDTFLKRMPMACSDD